MRFAKFFWLIGSFGLLFIVGCLGGERKRTSDHLESPSVSAIRAVRIEPARTVRADPERPGRLELRGARNEWIGFAIQIDARDGGQIRLVSPVQDKIPLGSSMKAMQLVDLPADINRASFVRHVGPVDVAPRALPRALLPIPGEGTFDLTTLRDPSNPADPSAHFNAQSQPANVWIDLHLPIDAAPGDYIGAIELLDARGRNVIERIEIALTLHDFVLPDRRNLQLVGDIAWDDLNQLFPDSFEAVDPKRLSRADARYGRAIGLLDSLVALAQEHRATVWIDRLQPIVKWRTGQPPDVDWRGFDSVAGAWLDGSAFPDREPLGMWPLPRDEFLANYTEKSQKEYLANAAAHFDSRDWLNRAPYWISSPARADGENQRTVLAEAASVLGSHSRLLIALPIEFDRIEYASEQNPLRPSINDSDRIIARSPGLVSTSLVRRAPNEVGSKPASQETYLDTTAGGPVPYVGAGASQADVRVLSWLAFLRNASFIRLGSALPGETSPTQTANPDELIWFYPGSWFGLDAPVPSLQLKWLRRAQQDFEYLTIAQQRGERINALLMARLITKPVEIQPAQSNDPIYALMSGTADPKAWDDAMKLLARLILLRRPGEPVDGDAQRALNIDTIRWMEPQERPLVIGRSVIVAPSNENPKQLDVRVGVDLYNASDSRPIDNRLRFAAVAPGWLVSPEPTPIPPLATYQVARYALAASVDPAQLDPTRRDPIRIEFTHGFTNQTTSTNLFIPMSISRRREGNLHIDGALGDWSGDDAILDGPLVQMFDRPGVLNHQSELVLGETSLYTAWSESNFYCAFKVTGVSHQRLTTAQNFVRYDFRRAWGEDVVQLLAQPVYADGTLGPVLSIACKPNGGQWSERKLDLRDASERAWQPLEGGVRYACRIDPKIGDADDDSSELVWRGEVAIPWRAIQPPNVAPGPDRRPVMIRFNFAQHQHDTGITGTWAGPVDHAREDEFTGVLVIRGE